MTFWSYHDEFPPSHDITGDVGAFTCSRRYFETSPSVCGLLSAHIDNQSYSEEKNEGVSGCTVR